MSVPPSAAPRAPRAAALRAAGLCLLAALAAVLSCPLAAHAAVPAGSPFAGRALFVLPSTTAAQAADSAAARGDLPTSTALRRLANQPQALWITGGAAAPAELITASAAASRQHRALVAVLYAVPHRDCSGASAGGVDAGRYRTLLHSIATPLGHARATVIVEPDALGLIDCLSAAQAQERYLLLHTAVTVLTQAGSTVYLDAGHAGWTAPAVMARRLRSAGVTAARGVALNVASYDTTASERAYGAQLAGRLPHLHVIIDTSRNGRGPTSDAQWCNAPNRAVGSTPHAVRDALVDALLWIKHPGESDGDCGRHEPPAGTFWTPYAMGLLSRA